VHRRIELPREVLELDERQVRHHPDGHAAAAPGDHTIAARVRSRDVYRGPARVRPEEHVYPVLAALVDQRGRHMPIFIEVNPGLFTTGQTAPSTRLFPAFALVRPTFSVAESRYEGNHEDTKARTRPTVTTRATGGRGHEGTKARR